MLEFEKLMKIIEAVIYGDKNDKFSKEGLRKYMACCISFITALYVESLKISKINQADNISKSHVSTANNNLIRKSGSKLLKLLGAFGGLFLGLSVNNLHSMVFLGQVFSSTGNVATVFFGIIGACMVVHNNNKE